ncbi:hypothetical protein BOX37_16615 [Nocardia mangyaensis]|uniref:Uncharacterized protein n=1 Tax=Nocardia mangyaensis TaxID=2213200 RepID=A0A1J0VTC3_9NOCA|nr:hypothetical protein [Nocardia mangyaensis]APE35299.1 hypothetical protein BOX37_16615 [Nocardia mangyaensis]
MQPVPWISELAPGLSVAVDTAFERALAKNPDHRYAHCAEMVTAIAHAVTTGAAPTQPSADPRAPLGHGTAPPHSHALDIGGRSAHGGARRGRTAWIAAAVVGVAAVLAVVATVVLTNRNEPGTGHAPGTTTAAPTTTADAWAAARPTIAMFPDLLPAGPDSAGYRDLRCSFATKNPDAMWDTGFSCTDRENLELQVLSHPDTETVGQFVATLPADTSQQVRSRYGRPLTVRSFQGTTGPWLLVQFDAAPHSTVLLQVYWKGHTHQEMIDEWLTSAPL